MSPGLETLMIELLTAPTPNGWKISIMLEECELPYVIRWVNLGRGEQHSTEFREVSPNGRIPAIVDHDPSDGGPPLAVFESGAILIYLAEKSGRLLPSAVRPRAEVLAWLHWQVGGLGPMLGQNGHFKLYAPEQIPYALERYRREALRLYGVLDRRLTGRTFIADDYSIADIACFPWIQTWRAQDIELATFPALAEWYQRLKERDGLRRGMALGRDRLTSQAQEDPQARRILFGIGERDDG
jgi:GSH-dependent disulfide-bond oxidoreductase